MQIKTTNGQFDIDELPAEAASLVVEILIFSFCRSDEERAAVTTDSRGRILDVYRGNERLLLPFIEGLEARENFCFELNIVDYAFKTFFDFLIDTEYLEQLQDYDKVVEDRDIDDVKIQKLDQEYKEIVCVGSKNFFAFLIQLNKHFSDKIDFDVLKRLFIIKCEATQVSVIPFAKDPFDQFIEYCKNISMNNMEELLLPFMTPSIIFSPSQLLHLKDLNN